VCTTRTLNEDYGNWNNERDDEIYSALRYREDSERIMIWTESKRSSERCCERRASNLICLRQNGLYILITGPRIGVSARYFNEGHCNAMKGIAKEGIARRNDNPGASTIWLAWHDVKWNEARTESNEGVCPKTAGTQTRWVGVEMKLERELKGCKRVGEIPEAN